jgi:hypothetical protein
MHNMRIPLALIIVAATCIAAASADRHVAPIRAYPAVEVTLPQPLNDAGLDAFRAELIKVARARVYAGLAPLVAAQQFFWDRDFNRKFDPRRPGVDNLAAALRLEHGGGAGWDVLARLVAETRATALVSRPGVVCAPGSPSFDGIAFEQLVAATLTEPADWAYADTADVAVRTEPRIEGRAQEILGVQFVRALDLGAAGWTKVAAPGGAVGFVAPGTLRRLGAPQLCYGRDPAGRWQVFGYIGREP